MSYIWWRDGCNLPSVKALKAVFGDKAKEARQLLEGNIKSRDFIVGSSEKILAMNSNIG